MKGFSVPERSATDNAPPWAYWAEDDPPEVAYYNGYAQAREQNVGEAYERGHRAGMWLGALLTMAGWVIGALVWWLAGEWAA